MRNPNKPIGWRREPVRHGLAAKGIKTVTKAQENLASQIIKSENRALLNLEDATIKNYKGMEYYKDLTDGLWKVKDKNGDVFVVALDDSDGRKVVKSANNEATAKKYIDWVSPKGDADKDGIQNSLDCEPLNPNKQGVFDDLKKKVQDYEKKRDEKKLEEYRKRTEEEQKKVAEAQGRLEEKLNQEKEKLSAKRKLLQQKKAYEKEQADLKKIENELDKEKIERRERLKSKARKFGKATVKATKSGFKYIKKEFFSTPKKVKKKNKPGKNHRNKENKEKFHKLQGSEKGDLIIWTNDKDTEAYWVAEQGRGFIVNHGVKTQNRNWNWNKDLRQTGPPHRTWESAIRAAKMKMGMKIKPKNKEGGLFDGLFD